MRKYLIFLISLGLLAGCERTQSVKPFQEPASQSNPNHDVRTFTLQYRTAMDAVSPSAFVAIYPDGMTMGLKIQWKIKEKDKALLDALLEELEKRGENGKEFTARGKWILEGFELEVYEIKQRF